MSLGSIAVDHLDGRAGGRHDFRLCEFERAPSSDPLSSSRTAGVSIGSSAASTGRLQESAENRLPDIIKRLPASVGRTRKLQRAVFFKALGIATGLASASRYAMTAANSRSSSPFSIR
jgi:hypothetical protein